MQAPCLLAQLYAARAPGAKSGDFAAFIPALRTPLQADIVAFLGPLGDPRTSSGSAVAVACTGADNSC